MAVKIIKHRLFSWFEEVDSPVHSDEKVLTERIAHLGQEVDITNPAFVKRGEELGSFYTDAEAKQIREGTYRGEDADILYRHRSGQLAAPQAAAIEGEGPQVDSLSTEELGDYIYENKLNVDQTVALAGDSLESIEKVLDAENLASDNEPRKGVTDRLEAKMKAITA